MDVSNRPQQLVSVELDEHRGNILFLFHVVLHDLVQRVRHVLHDNVQVDLVVGVSVRVKIMPQLYAEWVSEDFQNLKLAIFVSLVLVDLFNGDSIANCISIV